MKRLVAIALLPLALAAFAPQPPADAPRLSAGERRQLSWETTETIVRQLIDNGCWTDHRDMPDARRLSAIVRIYIGADGRLLRDPELVSPASEPLNDVPLKTFIGYVREALAKCNAVGFKLSPESFELLRDNYVDLQFTPRIG